MIRIKIYADVTRETAVRYKSLLDLKRETNKQNEILDVGFHIQ